jgi:hypothetical protein
LNPDTSLEQAGVTHGSRLLPRARNVDPDPVPVDEVSRNPLGKTRDVLPEQYGPISRLRRLLAAAPGGVIPTAFQLRQPTRSHRHP